MLLSSASSDVCNVPVCVFNYNIIGRGYNVVVAQIIDLGSKNSSLVFTVMEETGSLGANIIIDDGGTHLLLEISSYSSMLFWTNISIAHLLNGQISQPTCGTWKCCILYIIPRRSEAVYL